MRYTGPRNKIARREGMDLGLKTPGSKSHASLLKKLNISPGQHGSKGKRKISERGRQLRETQKLKFLFGLTTKQLKNYLNKAAKRPGNTAIFLAQYLEKRLDNIVYRLGFAPTRASARQLVCHKHIKINDKIVNIPSYQMRRNDVLTFADEHSIKIPYIEKILTNKDLLLPPWLEKKAIVGKLINEPNSDLIEKQVNLRLVVEYYSR